MANDRLTIKKSFELSGVGLHSGKKVNVVIKPSNVNGIFFKRIDIPKSDFIKVDVKNVVNTKYSIDLCANGVVIRTVEHVLSALYGIGVDDCLIKLDNEEFPIFDGSAEQITKNILKVGLEKSKYKRETITLKKPMLVSLNGSCIVGVPSNIPKISIAVSYDNKFIGTQYAEFELNDKIFKNEIARAKTFGWFSEIKKEKKKGLVKGGSFRNALVYGDKGLINKKIQRFKNEPVRHKVLDLIGALSFLQKRINFHLIGIKTGHTMDITFVKEVLRCRY